MRSKRGRESRLLRSLQPRPWVPSIDDAWLTHPSPHASNSAHVSTDASSFNPHPSITRAHRSRNARGTTAGAGEAMLRYGCQAMHIRLMGRLEAHLARR